MTNFDHPFRRRSVIFAAGLLVWLAGCGLISWLSAEFQYALLTTRPYPEHEFTPAMRAEIEQEVQHKGAIVYELWLSRLIPPPFRPRCYTDQPFGCDFVGRNRKTISTWRDYGLNIGLVSSVVLIPALLSGGLAWWLMRRKKEG